MINKSYNIFLLFIAIIISSCNNGSKTSEIKLIPVKIGNQYGYIDNKGKIIINPQFSEASIFRDGLALVRSSDSNRKWGFIDEYGHYVISPKYIDATPFIESLAWVITDDGTVIAIDKDERKITSLRNVEWIFSFHEGLACYSVRNGNSEKWGVIEKKGKIVISPQFDAIDCFSEGKCAVQKTNGKWGYIGSDGKLLIDYQFDFAKKFYQNTAVVTLGNKKGLIDDNGKFIINPQYEDIYIDGDILLVEQNGKWGWIDRDGKSIISPQFLKAYPFYDNKLAPVQSESNWGYINMEGKFEINPQYSAALPFINGLSLVQSNKKIGFIDDKGIFVINPQFEDISNDYLNACFPMYKWHLGIRNNFFNIDAFVQYFNKSIVDNTVEGVNFKVPIKNVLSKFKVDSIFRNEVECGFRSFELFRKPIFKDVNLTFSVNYIIDTDNYSEKSEYLDRNEISSFEYRVDFSNHSDKKIEVMKAIKESFKNYHDIYDNSGVYQHSISNGQNFNIYIREDYDDINIKIDRFSPTSTVVK